MIVSHSEWIQLNLGLGRPALMNARAVFGCLQPLISQGRQEGWLKVCFFMRKPPDIRLRFYGVLPESLAQTLSELMDPLLQHNRIHTYFFSHYEPETERFGGSEAMAAVHQ